MTRKNMLLPTTLAALALLFAPACSKSKDKALCKSITKKMIDCGIMSAGDFACGFEDKDYDRCQLDCFEQASCASLEALLCRQETPTDLTACGDACAQRFGFACTSGESIPPTWQCDGWLDCQDNSDERNCPTATFFFCLDGSDAIATDWVCDTEEDCLDGSDEVDCPAPFDCADGAGAIPANWVCDGWLDCPDGSDEGACQGNTVFNCADGTASIPQVNVCNEAIECEDASDELDCPGDIVFPCADGVSFVYTDWVCDLEADCPDSSDEVGCAQLTCPQE